MSETITLDHLKSHPIMGTWSIAGAAEEYPGFLSLEDDNLNLTIYLTVAGNAPFDVLQQTDPRFIPFAPPNQPTLHGQTKAAGRVTLFNCAQLSTQSSIRLKPPEARVELRSATPAGLVRQWFCQSSGGLQAAELSRPWLA